MQRLLRGLLLGWYSIPELMQLLLGLALALALAFLMSLALLGCAGPLKKWEAGWLSAKTNQVATVTATAITNEAGEVGEILTTNYREQYTFTPGTNVKHITRSVRALDGVLGGWGELIALAIGGLATTWASLRTKLAKDGMVTLAEEIETMRAVIREQPGDLDPAVVEYLERHQQAWGTREVVEKILREVDPMAAKATAAVLLKEGQQTRRGVRGVAQGNGGAR